MEGNLQYNGRVTINFYDKKGNLKGTHVQYNHGTPYLFAVLEELLRAGTNETVDNRPGRIMLTSPCFINRNGTQLSLQNGGYDTTDGYSTEDGSPVLLSSSIPRVGTPLTTQTASLYDGGGNLI